MTSRHEQRRAFNRHKAREIVRLLKIIVTDPVKSERAENSLEDLLAAIFNHEEERHYRW